MKPSLLIITLFLLIGFKGLSQTNTIKGKITEVKPAFGGGYSLMVEKTELILIKNIADTTGNTFEINKEYKDILIPTKENKYALNPKYTNQSFKITYKINGKGWKCIQNLKLIKK